MNKKCGVLPFLLKLVAVIGGLFQTAPCPCYTAVSVQSLWLCPCLCEWRVAELWEEGTSHDMNGEVPRWRVGLRTDWWKPQALCSRLFQESWVFCLCSRSFVTQVSLCSAEFLVFPTSLQTSNVDPSNWSFRLCWWTELFQNLNLECLLTANEPTCKYPNLTFSFVIQSYLGNPVSFYHNKTHHICPKYLISRCLSIHCFLSKPYSE